MNTCSTTDAYPSSLFACPYAAVAATDNEHLLRVRVGEHRELHHHFLVGELVALAQLDHAVEREHAAVGRAVEDLDQLAALEAAGEREVARLLVQQARGRALAGQLQAEALARPCCWGKEGESKCSFSWRVCVVKTQRAWLLTHLLLLLEPAIHDGHSCGFCSFGKI